MITHGIANDVSQWDNGALVFTGRRKWAEVVLTLTDEAWEQLARIVRDRDFATEAEARLGTTSE